MNVLVIYGGTSSERDISLMSGSNIAEALQKAGHSVAFFDPASGMHKLSDSLRGIDVVFPILHGKGGEDGFIQNALELENVKYVGSNSDVSALCFDKWDTVQQAPHILFPKSELVSYENVAESELVLKPYVIKPRSEGSSVDTFIVKNPKEFDLNDLEPIFAKYHDELLIEEYISGTEITVGILDTTPLPIVEIIPPLGQDFDYTNKYNGATQELCPPKHVSKSLQQQAQEIALNLHTTMGCRHFSRTDMIIDESKKIYTLEINTLPGMTKQSLFPLAAAQAGYDLPKLVATLVTRACN